MKDTDMDQFEPSNLKILSDWIDNIAQTGGVEDCGYATMDAMRAAIAVCWSVVDRSPHLSRNDMSQLGVKYLAAFMVSCAKCGQGEIASVFSQPDNLSETFKAQADRSKGFLENILVEASQVPQRLAWSALLSAGAYIEIASSGRGKERGKIG